MSEPVCAQKSPIQLTLEPGQYWWCACGRSQKQPFCDGSHKGTDFTPNQFKLDEKKTMWLCACKRTKTAPNCDGTHKSLA
ncbi:MAG: CDGSH iron-sulfur domain-containing protein [Gammaproteobacteria bacterium]|nr:CDGSH iron-sulfur domain-containing protein [Gammaproteobacteria bacterium]